MHPFFYSDDYLNKDDGNGEYNEEYGIRLLALISEFFLQIRKDIYKKKTRLLGSNRITDMEQTKDKINNYA